MRKQFYTVMVFPGSSGSPKEFRVSKALVVGTLWTLSLFILGFAGSGYFFSKKYQGFNDSSLELTDLRREAKIHKVQVERFSQQIKNFETEMARLERFEKKLRVITASENSPNAVEKNWGVGGPLGLAANSFTTALDQDGKSIAERFASQLEQLDGQARLQFISFQELDEFFKNQSSLLSATPSIWPTRGWITSGFGYRKSPFTNLKEKHEGWDIAARSGSQIRATADGVISASGRDYGYGKMVEIDHGYGVVTRYGHNSKNLVKAGARVKRGQVIALVGSTGRSTGPHLHYEVLLNGVPVSPKNYILED